MRSRLAFVAIIATALALPTADALARSVHGGGGGFRGGGGGGHAAIHGGGFRGGHFSSGRHFRGRRHFFVGGFGYYGDSCWRGRWTPFGWRRVWVCDYPYYPY